MRKREQILMTEEWLNEYTIFREIIYASTPAKLLDAVRDFVQANCDEAVINTGLGNPRRFIPDSCHPQGTVFASRAGIPMFLVDVFIDKRDCSLTYLIHDSKTDLIRTGKKNIKLLQWLVDFLGTTS